MFWIQVLKKALRVHSPLWKGEATIPWLILLIEWMNQQAVMMTSSCVSQTYNLEDLSWMTLNPQDRCMKTTRSKLKMSNWDWGPVPLPESYLAREKSQTLVGKKWISTSSAGFQEHSGPIGCTVCMTPTALPKGLQVTFVHPHTLFLPFTNVEVLDFNHDWILYLKSLKFWKLSCLFT